MAVTPAPGLASVVTAGGTPVIAAGPNPNGGFITNPNAATESIFVDPVGAAAVVAGGTTFEVGPGQTWDLIPGQTTNTSVNAVTSGHAFSIVVF